MVKPQAHHSKASKYLVSNDCLIQEGGTGKIFMAQNQVTEEYVAVKVIDLQFAAHKIAFQNEVALLNATRDLENVIHIHEHFIYQNRGYIVMDLENNDLFHRSESLDNIEEIRYIFFQICQAVKQLHDRNIAHMDLKPENILLDYEDTVKLCDFGNSVNWFGSDDRCSEIIGSEYYLAPEILQRNGYHTTKADVWSLGILLHFLLTGQFPYAGCNDQESYSKYIQGEIYLGDIKELFPEDDTCYNLLKKMLNKNPAARPSVSKLLQDKFFSQNEMDWEFSSL